jgi:hypothetical protein
MAQEVTPPQALEGRLTRAQIGIIAVTMLGTLGLSVFDKPAAPFAVVSLGVLLLLRFGDIASLTLKGFGAEAVIQRAERAVSEADRAVEALKQLGMNLSKTVLTLQAIQGRRGSVPTLRGSLRARNVIVSNLQDLGLTFDEAEQAAVVFDDFMVFDLVTRAIHFAPDGPGKDRLKTEWVPAPLPLPAITHVRASFEHRECLTPMAEQLLVEAERYQNTRQIDLEKIV